MENNQMVSGKDVMKREKAWEFYHQKYPTLGIDHQDLFWGEVKRMGAGGLEIHDASMIFGTSNQTYLEVEDGAMTPTSS